jgi:type IV fimbrial biogenesis protein FimT
VNTGHTARNTRERFRTPRRVERRRSPAWRRSIGISLVEIAVVLCIVATLGALGAGGYGGLFGRTRATVDADALLGAIELTRAEAAKRGRRVTLLPAGGDWSQGWTVFVDLDANRRVDPGEPVVLVHAPLDRKTRVVTNTTPGYIAFAPRGTPQQYSGAFLAATIELCDSGTSRAIVLARTGRPRLVNGVC